MYEKNRTARIKTASGAAPPSSRIQTSRVRNPLADAYNEPPPRVSQISAWLDKFEDVPTGSTSSQVGAVRHGAIRIAY
jgi:hypothetical protein